MNIPIVSDGSACVGNTLTLYACCRSDVDVEWFVDMGDENVSIAPNGHTAEITIINAGGYKIRATCCRENT